MKIYYCRNILALIGILVLMGCSHHGDSRDAVEEAKLTFGKGQEAYSKGMPDSALYYFNYVGKKYADSPSAELRNLSAEAFNTNGVIEFLQGNYPESVDNFLVAEQVGNDSIRARVYNNIASIFHYFKDDERSLEYLEKATEGGLRTGEWDVVRSATLNILNYCFEVNETGKALPTMERFLNAPLPDEAMTRYVTQTGLGMRASVKDSLPEAEAYFRNAIAISSSLPGGQRYEIMSYNHLARAMLAARRYDRALAYLDTVAELCSHTNHPDSFMALAELRAECYGQLGDRKREYEERLKYIAMKDSAFSAKEFGKILDRQSANKIERINTMLHSEQDLRKNRERMIAALTLLVVVVLGGGAWIWLQNRRLREAMRVLYEKSKRRDYENLDLPVAPVASPAPTGSDKLEEDDPANLPKVMEEEQARRLADDITAVLEKEKPYLQASFSIKELADRVGSNSKYVSYALNHCLGKTFPTLVNTLRIEEACRMLRSEAAGRTYTIESIANEVGFKSRTGFSATFKKMVGLTPREYIQMARQDKQALPD